MWKSLRILVGLCCYHGGQGFAGRFDSLRLTEASATWSAKKCHPVSLMARYFGAKYETRKTEVQRTELRIVTNNTEQPGG